MPPRRRGFLVDLFLELQKEISGHLLLTRRTKNQYGMGHFYFELDDAVLGPRCQPASA